MHSIGLPTSSYISVVLRSLTFTNGTDKTRMNPKIKQILPSIKLGGYSFELCQELVDKCDTKGYFSTFHLSTRLGTTDK